MTREEKIKEQLDRIPSGILPLNHSIRNGNNILLSYDRFTLATFCAFEGDEYELPLISMFVNAYENLNYLLLRNDDLQRKIVDLEKDNVFFKKEVEDCEHKIDFLEYKNKSLVSLSKHNALKNEELQRRVEMMERAVTAGRAIIDSTSDDNPASTASVVSNHLLGELYVSIAAIDANTEKK